MGNKRKKELSESEYIKKCVKEVRKWPQWKKEFAADVYSVDPNIFDNTKEKKCR